MNFFPLPGSNPGKGHSKKGGPSLAPPIAEEINQNGEANDEGILKSLKDLGPML